MDEKRAKARFVSQKHGAKRRGIAWELTFEQWLEWWGDDLDNRGPYRDQLGMCRKADAGPYAMGNIYKGTPRDNQRTAGKVKSNRFCADAKQKHEAYLNSLMWEPSKVWEERDYSTEEAEHWRAIGALDDRKGYVY